MIANIQSYIGSDIQSIFICIIRHSRYMYIYLYVSIYIHRSEPKSRAFVHVQLVSLSCLMIDRSTCLWLYITGNLTSVINLTRAFPFCRFLRFRILPLHFSHIFSRLYGRCKTPLGLIHYLLRRFMSFLRVIVRFIRFRFLKYE